MSEKIHLIPGTQCNAKLWSALAPYLSNDVELVHLDIPLHTSFDDIVRYYYRMISDQDINLVGFSLGGYIASYFACRYSERVKRLFVIANSPTHLSDNEIYQRAETSRLIERHGYKGMSPKKATMMLDPSHHNEAFIRPILEMDADLGVDNLLSQYTYTTERYDLAEELRRLPCPSAFYYSDQDPLVDTQWLRTLYQTAPKVTLLTTAGSGHMLPLEKPQELAAHLNNWLVS